MSDRQHIRDFIVKTIEKKAPLPAGVDIDAFNYIDSGYVDSIGIIKFVLDLESAFGIDISPEDIESKDFRTIGGLVALVERRIKGE